MTRRVTQAAVLGGAALLIVGSLMTWISVDLGFSSFSSAGTDNIEGKLTAGAGALLVGVGLIFTRRDRAGRMSGYLGLGAAIFAGVVLALEYLDVRDRIAEAEGTAATATVGLGVWVTALGVVATLVALAASLMRERRSGA